METSNIISEGLTLLALGMGFVFMFLTVLVIATTAMSYLINKFSTPEPTPIAQASSTPAAVAIDPNVLTAIKEALKLHRQQA